MKSKTGLKNFSIGGWGISRFIESLAISFLLMAVGGCAAVCPGADLVAKIPSNGATASFADAASGVTAVVPKNGIRFKLNVADRVFVFPGYLSYYKVFKLPESLPGKFDIRVTGECTCLGFDKRTPVPVAYVISSAGEVLKPLSTKYSVRGATLVDLDMVIEGLDAKYILVAADNSMIDQDIGHIHILSRGVDAFDLAVRSYPVGTFHLTYQILPEQGQ